MARRTSQAPVRHSATPAIAIPGTRSPRTATPSKSATTGIRNAVAEARVAPASGLHLATWAIPDRSVDLAQVARSAGERGVKVQTLSEYYIGGPERDGLVIGYGAIPASRIDEGTRLLDANFIHDAKRRLTKMYS